MGCITCLECNWCGNFLVCPKCGSTRRVWDEEFPNMELWDEKYGVPEGIDVLIRKKAKEILPEE